MSPSQIVITQVDAEKLRLALRDAEGLGGYRGSPYIVKLKEELHRAQIVPPQEVPPDVITMNTRATLLDLETGEEMEFTLVFPEAADVSLGKISVLAPIGTAMLGYRVGDSFEWDTPGGKRTLQVVKVLDQPEASGNYT